MKKGYLICCIILILIIGIFTNSFIDVNKNISPTGEYEIISIWIDKGGFGYGGSFYLKKSGFFSKWHKLGEVPFSCEWISDDKFSVTQSSHDYIEYDIREFLN